MFDWAQAVPVNYTVELHNTSAPTGANLTAVDHNVTISRPFNASQLALITPYMSNTTMVNLSGMGIWSAQYATLSIVGNKAYAGAQMFNGSNSGASVAEFVIVGEQSGSMAMQARGARIGGREVAVEKRQHDERLKAWGRYMKGVDAGKR